MRARTAIAPALCLVASPPATGQEGADMRFGQPPPDPAEVSMTEGFSSLSGAAYEATIEARRLSRCGSTRPDGGAEREFGGVLYRAEDGSYGYTSPRSDFRYAGEPRPGIKNGTEVGAVSLGTGIRRPTEDGAWQLMTPEGEEVVGTYHIHPEDGRNDPQSAEGPSRKDIRMARRDGLPEYVLAPEGFAVAEPDGTVRRLVGFDAVPRTPGTTTRPFRCGPHEQCDDGRAEVACEGSGTDLACRPVTGKPCHTIRNLPQAVRDREMCRRAIEAFRSKRATVSPSEPAAPQSGGLLGAVEEATNTLGIRLLGIAEGSGPVRKPIPVHKACGLDRPFCPLKYQ